MGKEFLLKIWPRKKRLCNIGDCPAFHMTDQDWENVMESSRVVEERGMEEAVRQYGVPVGTCKVSGAEVVVNSRCKVSDDDFADYYGRLAEKK